jgi:hypothetical protein
MLFYREKGLKRSLSSMHITPGQLLAILLCTNNMCIFYLLYTITGKKNLLQTLTGNFSWIYKPGWSPSKRMVMPLFCPSTQMKHIIWMLGLLPIPFLPLTLPPL